MIISYELSIGLTVLTMVMLSGTMDIQQIVSGQADGWNIFKGHIPALDSFIIYLIAEAFHVSGVLAVVAGGLVNVISPRESNPSVTRMNIVSTNVWHVISFGLNGIVFVLLGTQLPGAMSHTWEDPSLNNGYLLLVILA